MSGGHAADDRKIKATERNERMIKMTRERITAARAKELLGKESFDSLDGLAPEYYSENEWETTADGKVYRREKVTRIVTEREIETEVWYEVEV
jgi:hypothetical protein